MTVHRLLFAFVFVAAGLNHLLHPNFYLRMMPPYLPWPRALVLVSGVAEIALGLLLLLASMQAFAAWGLIALLVAVFPANVHMALNADLFPEFSRAALWWRLPIQGLLIAWAYAYTRCRRLARSETIG